MGKKYDGDEKELPASVTRERAKVKAIAEIIEFIDDTKNVPDEIKAAVNTLRRKRCPPGQRKVARVDNIAFLTAMFKAKKVLTDAEVYIEYGLTRAEMGSKRKAALNAAPTPADRLWIMYDEATRTYTFKGKKEEAPKGYVGPFPKDYDGSQEE